MGKKIVVDGHGVINACRVSQTLWDDVWCSWTVKPGRKNRYCFAPCLCSRTDLERHIDFVKTYNSEKIDDEDLQNLPGYDLVKDVNPFEEGEIQQSENIISCLDKGKLYIDDTPGDTMPEIYTPAEFIDREEAERMLRIVLKIRFGFENVRFKWTRPRIVVLSV